MPKLKKVTLLFSLLGFLVALPSFAYTFQEHLQGLQKAAESVFTPGGASLIKNVAQTPPPQSGNNQTQPKPTSGTTPTTPASSSSPPATGSPQSRSSTSGDSSFVGQIARPAQQALEQASNLERNRAATARAAAEKAAAESARLKTVAAQAAARQAAGARQAAATAAARAAAEKAAAESARLKTVAAQAAARQAALARQAATQARQKETTQPIPPLGSPAAGGTKPSLNIQSITQAISGAKPTQKGSEPAKGTPPSSTASRTGGGGNRHYPLPGGGRVTKVTKEVGIKAHKIKVQVRGAHIGPVLIKSPKGRR